MDADVVVAAVVEVLDITHLGVRVVGDDLTSVPTWQQRMTETEIYLVVCTFITGSRTHGVEEDWLGDGGAVDLAVGVGHALVQSLQGEVGGVVWLLRKYVACEEIIHQIVILHNRE